MQERGKQLAPTSFWVGGASLFLYGATQLLAAPQYPGYDRTSQRASELGTVGSASSATFNLVIVRTGVATIASAFGFKQGLQCIGGN